MTSSSNNGASTHGWLIPLTVALIVGLGAAGGTYTLWSDHDAQAQLISSGDLKVKSLANPSWQDTSPDVTDFPREIDPTTFFVRPGDTLAVTIPFEATVRGDNMHTELSVDWSAESTVPTGISGTYTLVGSQGNPLHKTPLKLGQAMEFSAHDGGYYAVQIDLGFANLANRFGAEAADPLSELGNFDVEIHQVRPGGGAS